MSEYFPEPKFFGKVKVESDLSNYTTKADLKNETGIDALSFAKRVDLANIKSNVDKLDIDKLKNVPTNLNNLKNKVDTLNVEDVDELIPVPVDLSKLSDVAKNDVVKKDLYSAKIKNVEDKMPDITNLATKTNTNAKINEVKGEIPSITNQLQQQLLLLLKIKTDYNTKINEIGKKITDLEHSNKYITTPEFNKLTPENFPARLTQANLASKSYIANFVNKTDFDNQVKNITSKKR